MDYKVLDNIGLFADEQWDNETQSARGKKRRNGAAVITGSMTVIRARGVCQMVVWDGADVIIPNPELRMAMESQQMWEVVPFSGAHQR